MKVEQVTLAYGDRIVVDGVSLELNPSKIIAIVGPNGAGKSTLLRALNGGLKPVSGRILLEGTPVQGYTRQAISKRVAVVAQETDLRFPVTVLEFVLGGRYAWANGRAWGWESEHDLNVVGEVLCDTELTNLEDRMMSELSGGERQRCLLARALATDAPFLLLDEPTANMDLAHQASILELVRKRCDERKSAAIVITHDINLASHFADQVLLMKQGKKVAFGRPKDVFTPDLLKQVFDVQVLVDTHPVTGVPRVTPVHPMHR